MTDKREARILICGEFSEGEAIMTETDGFIYEINDKIHLIYNEKVPDSEAEISNHVVIDKNEIRVVKKGAVSLIMMFQQGLIHNTVYHTQAGPIAMSIKTDSVFKSISEEEININIMYTLEFEETEPIINRLKIQVRYK